jgi:hypothetical protein
MPPAAPHAAAGLAHHPRPRAAQLDLARGVRAVAELVLQALHLEAGVARAVGQHARQREARQALVGLGEDEEQVAHRRAAEPLVAGELVLGARSARAQRRGGGRVRAHVGAALLLGHRHPAQRAALLGRRPELGIVGGGRQQRHPLLGDVGLRAQRGDGGERHRDRAAEAGLGLDRAVVQRRARDVRAGPRRRPRQALQLLADAGRHERVP